MATKSRPLNVSGFWSVPGEATCRWLAVVRTYHKPLICYFPAVTLERKDATYSAGEHGVKEVGVIIVYHFYCPGPLERPCS